MQDIQLEDEPREPNMYRVLFLIFIISCAAWMMSAIAADAVNGWRYMRIQEGVREWCFATYGGEKDIHNVPLACRPAFPYSNQQSATATP